MAGRKRPQMAERINTAVASYVPLMLRPGFFRLQATVFRDYTAPGPVDQAQLEREALAGRELMKEMHRGL